MPMIVETELFTFDELTDAAREKAREWYRHYADFGIMAIMPIPRLCRYRLVSF
jgi:hypothetical protein